MTQSFSQMSSLRLQNRIKAILNLLRAKFPDEVAELTVLLEIENGRQTVDPKKSYARVRMPSTAVTMLLTEFARPMLKKDIYSELLRRGYPMETSSKKQHVADSMNGMLKRGELVKIAGERSDMTVSLPQHAPTQKKK